MFYVLCLILGLIAVFPLLWFVDKLSIKAMQQVLGLSLIVAALLYIGFAVIGGSTSWLAVEIIGLAIYGVFYYLSCKYTGIWLSVGWLLHPLWDVVLHLNGPAGHGVPAWYSLACVSFDIAVAIYILYRLRLLKNI
ncbi:hypothetical protein A9Q89_13085 [Gammaproteobacteria bacterium 53_120_T64]|mgnify:CR=1 FL=1|nr:hypothetical protein A9Q89_13085 [Gammaproteobacteria bacterium 53_120_T64]